MLSLLTPNSLGAIAIALLIGGSGGYYACSRIHAAQEARYEAAQHAQNEKIIVNDSEQSRNDQAVINNLNQQIRDLKDALPDPNSECFTADDVGKLQTIWKQDTSTRSPK